MPARCIHAVVMVVVTICSASAFLSQEPEPSWFNEPPPDPEFPDAVELAKARWWGTRRFSERFEAEFGRAPRLQFNFGYLASNISSAIERAVVDEDLDSKYIDGIDPDLCRAPKRLIPTIALNENTFEHLFVEHGPLKDP